MFLGIDRPTYQGQVKQKGAYSTFQVSSPLNYWVSCFWQLVVDEGSFVYRSVPDNCIDWIFNLDEPRENFIVSPFTSPIEFPLLGPVSYFGIRFRILGYQGLIDSPVGEWRSDENCIDAAQLISNQIIEQIYEASYRANSFRERCDFVSSILLGELKYPTIDQRLARFIRHISSRDSTGSDSIKLNSSEFGISERQLRRLSQLHLGLSIKDFWKVTRFQMILHMMNTRGNNSIWVDHYYDQSHYIREFKSLTGATPSTFLNMSVLYNKEAH